MDSPTIIARFFISRCEVWQQSDGTIAANVTLKACQRADGDNVSWTKWTPTGEMTKTVLNPKAAEFYRDNVGRDVRISIQLEDDRVWSGLYTSEAEQERIDAKG